MPTDTTERGLETLIVRSLTGLSAQAQTTPALRETAAAYGGAGYVLGNPADYDREHALDLHQLTQFIAATQPNVAAALRLHEDTPRRTQFLHRVQGEIAKRGTIDVLRKGIRYNEHAVDLLYTTPTPGVPRSVERWNSNVFSVTRQLRYSRDEAQRALDLVLFINGLPVATFELKNRLTGQTVDHAMRQYREDRKASETLFAFGRCVVHWAVDDQDVRFCTQLQNAASWFLPFNKGYDDGAGNPPNPDGIMTDYLWRETLTKSSLVDILENYAQVLPRTAAKPRQRLDFPRYHQLAVVRALLADVRARGTGGRYLVQHSAGSGKSNSIAWLAHQLVGVEHDGHIVFDSVIVVTDRRNLDRQIQDTIKQFAQVSATVGHANDSGDLQTFLRDGKKIIITTVQKFPFVQRALEEDFRARRFAIIIDEAHSSQTGRTAANMNNVLHGEAAADGEDTEDAINRLMAGRKMVPNASYFAFTATPKHKTLETFGTPEADTGRFKPFHVYTMKQAIQENFILDVLRNYTPIQSYYRLAKTVPDDPEFDRKRARKKLRQYVEGHAQAIRQKAEIMVDHFHEHVVLRHKIGGEARAMVVCNGIARAVEYYRAITRYLEEQKHPYRAIVAFSGDYNDDGTAVNEATLNGFPSSAIEATFKQAPYRFLVVADKFQTGYDEPLLHTMYVDKPLAGIKAVQTLSRLNRAHPKKHDTFVLDFANDTETIRASFEDYYRTTILSEATDPNKLHDLAATLEGYQVYGGDDIEQFVALYLGHAPRERLDPILDRCAAAYVADLDEDAQVDFKGKAKAFLRAYEFLGAILPYTVASWEKLSIFLAFLTPKLPAPREADLSQGILDAIDMDSYRAEVEAAMDLALADEDAVIDPVPTDGGGHITPPELERLSEIVRLFNDEWGNIFKDGDKMRQVIVEEIPARVSADRAYQNAMRQSDKQNARIELDSVLQTVIVDLLADHSELFKRYYDDPVFKKQLSDAIFAATYRDKAA